MLTTVQSLFTFYCLQHLTCSKTSDSPSPDVRLVQTARLHPEFST